MRRSKSDPAKYARNYRKISQRRMTHYDGVDEEKEMERLRTLLRNSERQLKQAEDVDAIPHSSRKRKRTLKQGQEMNGDPPGEESTSAPILSDELTLELGGYGGSGEENPLVVLPSKKKKRKDKKVPVALTPEEIREARATQKKTARKLQQLETRAAQKKKRVELYKRLEECQVVPQSRLQPLLQSSGKLSRKESVTKRQALKTLLTKERAGLSLSQEERNMLYPERVIDETTCSQQFNVNDLNGEGSTILNASKTTDKKHPDSPRSETIGPRPSSTSDQKISRSTDNSLETKLKTDFHKHDSTSTEKIDQPSAGATAASLMMASLSKLSKDSTTKLDTTGMEPLNDSSTQKESQKRYVPVNPAILKTAASMGLDSTSSTHCRKRSVVDINRPAEVEKTRFDLPVTAMEFEITDAVRNNDVTIICSETGSGKSTQVPSFLYEAGFTVSPNESDKCFLIGITQPRRVAAVSTAKRVCYEMGQGNGQSIRGSSGKGNLVSYQTKFEHAGFGENSRIKFMTDGVLLNEIQSDLLLRRYSVVVLDESHERNLNTDVLIGLLSVAIPLRKKAALEDPSLVPLRLVLMSATLRVEDFTKNRKLFPFCTPVVVNVPGRAYPVTIHHTKVTELDDYETSAFRKVCKIHRTLPRGGILVFLTGKNEIVRMVRRLQAALDFKVSHIKQAFRDIEAKEIDRNDSDFPREMDDDEFDGEDASVNDDDRASPPCTVLKQHQDEAFPSNAYILPLYSLLSAEEQAKVFAPVPANQRLIVIATNVAETSITIPGISYVVDTGRQKCRNYDSGTGVASYDIMWISKASADQRSGRAGRTGPGHCYRLYSSSLYSRHMDPFPLPEVLTRPLEDIALAMKAMRVSNISNFPFPTPPDRSQVADAIKLLADIGCLDVSNIERDGGDGTITRLGLAVSKLPLGVRYAKMLLVAAQAGVLDYAIIAVAAFSEVSPFTRNCFTDSLENEGMIDEDDFDIDSIDKMVSKDREKQSSRAKRWYHSSGDIFATISAIGAFTYAGKNAGGSSEELACRKFCDENGLNFTIMTRIQRVRAQLARLAKRRLRTASGVAAVSGSFSYKMAPPNKLQELFLLQSIASGFLDRVALLATPGSLSGDYPIDLRSAYIGCRSSNKEPFFLDRGCSLYSRDYRQLPRWVCYDSLVRKTRKDGTSVTIMKNVSLVDPQWLGEISKGTRLITLGAAVGSSPPIYDPNQDAVLCSVSTQYGSHGWILPPVRRIMHDVIISAKARAASEFLPDDSYRWFARFLWEGKVIPGIAGLRELMNDNPDLITRNSPSGKVRMLVGSLTAAGIDSGAALKKHWAENDRKFLFRCVKDWVKSEHHAAAKRIWIDAVEEIIKDWQEKNF